MLVTDSFFTFCNIHKVDNYQPLIGCIWSDSDEKGGEKGLFSMSMPYICESDRKQKHGKLIILVRVCFEYLLEAIYLKIFLKAKQKNVAILPCFFIQ